MPQKSILIVSHFFYPELTPRAFRTFELVREFCRQGAEVTLVLPNKEIYRKERFEMDGLSILHSNTPVKKTNASPLKPERTKANLTGTAITKLKQIGLYFFPREIYAVYDKGITYTLRSTKREFDMIISIAHPLAIHLSVMLAIFRNKLLRKAITIAEFSDPMFKGKYSATFPVNWLYGYLFSLTFKYFVTPVDAAVSSFLPFKSRKKIKVIPQGFNLTEYKTADYIPNKTITFAYAGSFYQELRNPKYFLDFLTEVEEDFVFKLYVPQSNQHFIDLITTYRNKIRGRIEIQNPVPRHQLIFELSEVDFLVNFNNENALMVPSKLIDYGITGRPIISFNSQTFNKNIFKDFLNRNYTQKVRVKLEDYDIKNIVSAFRNISIKS